LCISLLHFVAEFRSLPFPGHSLPRIPHNSPAVILLDKDNVLQGKNSTADIFTGSGIHFTVIRFGGLLSEPGSLVTQPLNMKLGKK
jgi:hypothetical protein